MLFEDECPICGEKRGYKFTREFIGCNDKWHDMHNDEESNEDNDYFLPNNFNSYFDLSFINNNSLFNLNNKVQNKNKDVSYKDSCIYWESCKYYEDGEYCYYCKDGEYYEGFDDDDENENDEDDDN